MQQLFEIIENKFNQAYAQLALAVPVRFNVLPAARVEFGDYQINDVMSVAKQLRQNPRELAQKLVEKVLPDPMFSKIEVAGPGFINITLDTQFLSSYLTLDNLMKVPHRTKKRRVVIDYSSPNLAKEMHVGHLRSTIIGDALVRIHEFLGDEVIRRNHVGDWGTQFGMLLAYLVEQQAADRNFKLKNLEDFYRKAKVRFDQDPVFADQARNFVVRLQAGDEEVRAIWRNFVTLSLSHCREIYQRLGVTLTDADAIGESAYNNLLPKIVQQLCAQGIAVDDQGTKCVFFAPGELPGQQNSAPFIIQKSDGGYLYATTDLAAVYDRVHNLKADVLLYVIDSRQSLHLAQLFATARKAGLATPTTEMRHVAFGTMLGEDNKPFKTRSGDTIKLSMLLDEAVLRAHKILAEHHPDWSASELNEAAQLLGVAAVKYADLAKNRICDYVFNLDQMLLFEGNTAPYLLYAIVRIRSLLRKHRVIAADALQQKITITNIAERQLALKLCQFVPTLQKTEADSCPHYLCNYLYELAGEFMHFYEACPIAQAEQSQQQSRLALATLVGEFLSVGLKLLGITPLDRM